MNDTHQPPHGPVPPTLTPGEAAIRLGIRRTDILSTGRKSVPTADVEAWLAEPPLWVVRARGRAQRREAAARTRKRNRLLAPAFAASRLGVKSDTLAAWMREARIDTPITQQQAILWATQPEQQPDWLRFRLRKIANEKAEREEALRAAEHERRNRSFDKVTRMLKENHPALRSDKWLDRHPDHSLALQEIAWRAAKDCGLASGWEHPDWWSLTALERQALRVFGYDVPKEPGDPESVVSLRMAQARHGGDPFDPAMGTTEPRRQTRRSVKPVVRPEKYAKDTATTVWVSRAILEARGWTAASIRDFLPPAEGYKQNPHYASAHPMPVWTPKTVAAAEATSEWQAWLAKSLHRRSAHLTGTPPVVSPVDGVKSYEQSFMARIARVHEAMKAAAVISQDDVDGNPQ